jgi:branched-chain amino acid transport system ATP-binding protein
MSEGAAVDDHVTSARDAAARDGGPRGGRPGQPAVLEARKLAVGYGSQAVVRDLDITVRAGEIVALLGVNGAGKTTTVRALAGELRPVSGEVWYRGRPTSAPLHRRAKNGLRLITEERSVFMGLSVADNLRLGGQEQARCLDLFPELRALLGRRAGLLSGGEQQMLTLARALAAGPVVLLADELSLGLAPMIVERLLAAVRMAADNGTGVLLVEQHVRNALEVADRAYVLSHGEVALEGPTTELLGRVEEIEESYLAASSLADADS